MRCARFSYLSIAWLDSPLIFDGQNELTCLSQQSLLDLQLAVAQFHSFARAANSLVKATDLLAEMPTRKKAASIQRGNTVCQDKPVIAEHI